MIAWTTVENAISSWVRGASGLPDKRVVWGRQMIERPSGPYIALTISSLRTIGQDGQAMIEESGEQKLLSRGQRECVVTMQCFGGTATEDTSPLNILESVGTRMILPTYLDALDEAGIGPAEFGPIQSLDGLLSETFLEPRAIAEFRFFLAQDVEDPNSTGTYIEFVELENDDTDESTYVPSDPT